MAINWVTVLAAVPWTEVIRNAPKVAEGARKLWSSAGRKGAKDGAEIQAVRRGADPALRIAALEASVDELSGQLQASAELIKALAEQNAQLVQRIETNRRRMLALSIVVLLMLAWLLALALSLGQG